MADGIRSAHLLCAVAFGISCGFAGAAADPELSRQVPAAVASWLREDPETRTPLAETEFGGTALTKADARTVEARLWESHVERIKGERAKEIDDREITIGDQTMRFEMKNYGSKPKEGRALFISMHGGGGTTEAANDSQWRNQIKLGGDYRPKGSLYVAPRAPTNSWNLWHKAHIDTFFDRLIEDLIVLEGIDPDRVFLMGYSAGGDGVYQLAPRMADRLAGACMMAGHPNEARPLGLRNIAFSIDMGEKDAAYDRNKVAEEWGKQLEELRSADPEGYEHKVNIRRGKGHWMDLEDKASVRWVGKFTRDPLPKKFVWFQDDVTHDRFYWLAMPKGVASAGQHVVAIRAGQTITIEKADGVPRLIVRTNDSMVDLDRPLSIVGPGGKILFNGVPERSAAVLAKTISERGDPRTVFSAEIEVEL